MRRIVLILILIISCIALYGVYFNIYGININEHHIKSKKIGDEFGELKYVHFSDLLYKSSTNKKSLNNLTKKINDLDADVIFFTGDLFSNKKNPTKEDIKDLTAALKDLNVKLYKYAVIGDNDNKHLDTYKQILEESDFILLDNESSLLFYKNLIPINIIGINGTDELDNMLESEYETSYTIALTHQADNYNVLKEKNIDLVLAGHTLNGQVRIPFYGGVIIKKDGKKYLDQYYNENNTKMFVNNGLGCEYYNIRLFNKPSINLYRITK